MISDDKKICEEILKVHGYRVTTGRVAILSAIKKSSKPLTALQLQEILSCDKVTLYRALDDFVHSRLLVKSVLRGVHFTTNLTTMIITIIILFVRDVV
jgi:Fe2+ or Zn2+ uptake regulation protein